jgi:hypothetical protein
MPEKDPLLASSLEPVTRALPAAVAGAIGQIVARQAYLEWVLGQVMYDLMEISIKQGRVILKFPRPGQFIAAVRDLYDFHALTPGMSLEDLSRKLDVADRTRTVLTRSIYMRSRGKTNEIVIARSPWDAGPGSEAQPEIQVVDDDFLARCKKNVESAVEAAEKLQATTDELLRKLHERRRTQRNLDRREKR